MAECLYVGGREPSSSNCCFSQTPDLLDLSDHSPWPRPAWSQPGRRVLAGARSFPPAVSWPSGVSAGPGASCLRIASPVGEEALGRVSLWRTQDSVQATQRGSPPPPAGLLSTGPARRCGGTRLTPAQLAAQSCRLDSRVAASSLSSAAQRSHVLSVHPEQGVPSEQEVYFGLAPRHSLPDCQDAPTRKTF